MSEIRPGFNAQTFSPTCGAGQGPETFFHLSNMIYISGHLLYKVQPCPSVTSMCTATKYIQIHVRVATHADMSYFTSCLIAKATLG